jgi:hypothetical protein
VLYVGRMDRVHLLSEDKRNAVLDLSEVRQYGRDSFNDSDYVCLYGMKPSEWYARGVRTLARTVVECTRDRLADLIGRDIAALVRTARGISGSVVIDPFAGSANTLYWITRHVDARRAVGFELDDAVFATSKRNVAIVGLSIELHHEPYERGLRAIAIREDELLIVFVAPPWGDALSEIGGLDLRRTQPPVTEIADFFAASFRGHKLLLAIQVHEAVDPDALIEVKTRFDSSALKIYDINAPGHRHGLLQVTRGWVPEPDASAAVNPTAMPARRWRHSPD